MIYKDLKPGKFFRISEPRHVRWEINDRVYLKIDQEEYYDIFEDTTWAITSDKKIIYISIVDLYTDIKHNKLMEFLA